MEKYVRIKDAEGDYRFGSDETPIREDVAKDLAAVSLAHWGERYPSAYPFTFEYVEGYTE